MPSYDRLLPSKFSRDYYAKAMRISAMPPLAEFVSRVWPGTTAMQWAGFMCNGGPDADTASLPGQQFHEIGYFGTTAGPSSVPYAPNTDRSQPNDWLRFYNDPRVVELLGREACFSRGCWKNSEGGFPDQCAVGLVSMLDSLESMSRRMGDAAPAGTGSTWALATSFAAWSAGEGGESRNFGPYWPSLAGYAESVRWDALRYLMADDYYRGRASVGRANSHTNPAYTAIRTQHKFACAIQDYQDDSNDVILSMAAAGIDPRSAGVSEPMPPPSPPSSGGAITAVAVTMLAASALVLAYRAYRRSMIPVVV
jgi:hypothetical protein